MKKQKETKTEQKKQTPETIRLGREAELERQVKTAESYLKIVDNKLKQGNLDSAVYHKDMLKIAEAKATRTANLLGTEEARDMAKLVTSIRVEVIEKLNKVTEAVASVEVNDDEIAELTEALADLRSKRAELNEDIKKTEAMLKELKNGKKTAIASALN